jgi:hypothetical protein
MQLFDEILPALEEAEWCTRHDGKSYALVDLGEEKIGVGVYEELTVDDKVLEVIRGKDWL